MQETSVVVKIKRERSTIGVLIAEVAAHRGVSQIVVVPDSCGFRETGMLLHIFAGGLTNSALRDHFEKDQTFE